jgi:hypothetical protein
MFASTLRVAARVAEAEAAEEVLLTDAQRAVLLLARWRWRRRNCGCVASSRRQGG